MRYRGLGNTHTLITQNPRHLWTYTGHLDTGFAGLAAVSFAFCGKIEQANRYFCSRVWGTFHHDKGIKSSMFGRLGSHLHEYGSFRK